MTFSMIATNEGVKDCDSTYKKVIDNVVKIY